MIMAYVPRLTAPSSDDLRWIMVQGGGYNQCIAGSWPGGISNYPSVLPNCTGYVHGRCMELANVTTDNLGLSFGNAVEYWTGCSSEWIQSSEPSLGAVIVYESIPGYGTAGHVAIVEEIIDADTIVCSQSDYEIAYFTTYTLYRQYNWAPYPYPGYQVDCLGFLINPYISPEPTPTPTGTTGLLKKWYTCNAISGKIRKRRL